MSAIAGVPIVCGGCDRKFAWKEQLAGKRVKCKCGHVIAVRRATAASATMPAAVTTTAAAQPVRPKPPSAAPPPPPPKPFDPSEDLDGLMALAADADRASAAMPIDVRDVPVPVIPVAAPPGQSRTAAAIAATGLPLGYQRGPTAAELQKVARQKNALVAPIRDVYVPSILLAVSLLLYVSYFGHRFHLGAGGLTLVTVGLGLVLAFKTALLVGAAFMLAGPLGIGFGMFWHAVLKLAATAVLTDGVTAWVDGTLLHAGLGRGMSGYTAFGWAISVGLYCGMICYLFDLEFTEVRMFVVILGIFSRLIRFVVMMFLLSGILSLGGVSTPVAATAGTAASAGPASTAGPVSPVTAHVDGLRAAGSLVEARKFIAGGNQSSLSPYVANWYAAGCPNVSFEMSGRDINGRRSPMGLTVELPADPQGRAKAYDVFKRYNTDLKLDADPDDYKDTGETYLMVELR